MSEYDVVVLKSEIRYAENQMAEIKETVAEETARDYTWKDSDFERRMIDLLLMHRTYKEKVRTLKPIVERMEQDNER